MAAPRPAGGDHVFSLPMGDNVARSKPSASPRSLLVLRRVSRWVARSVPSGLVAMGSRMSARRRLTLLAMLGLVLTLSVAGAALVCLTELSAINHRLAQVNHAQRFHQDADMMHDALRADVVRAQQAVDPGAPEVHVKEVAAETADHIDKFREDLTRLNQLHLPPDLERAVARLRPAQDRYITSAAILVRATLTGDKGDTVSAEREHNQAFVHLQNEQEAVTKLMGKASRHAEKAAAAEEMEAVLIVAGAAVAAMVGWMAVLLWHHRSSGRLNGALLREAAHRSAADLLQQSLLPARMPSVDGVQLAGRSLPGELGQHVGGDWYDVFNLPTGELGLVVGDVVGHDLAAATAMGQLRNALRAYALDDFSPARVLTRLNRAADLLDVVELATCIYAILDPRTLTVRWSSAGHFPPLVADEAGTADLAAVDPGPPLGALPDPTYFDSVLQLSSGDALVLYTDGLVERRGEAIDAGLEHLAAIRGPHDSAEAMCDLLVSSLLGDRPRGDDVTLLVVQTAATVRSATA